MCRIYSDKKNSRYYVRLCYRTKRKGERVYFTGENLPGRIGCMRAGSFAAFRAQVVYSAGDPTTPLVVAQPEPPPVP